MNVILNPIQSDTKEEDISLPANSNLTGLEGYLVKLVNLAANPGNPGFDLPGGVTDPAYYVLGSGDVAGNIVAAEAPGLGEELPHRIQRRVQPRRLPQPQPECVGAALQAGRRPEPPTTEFQAEEAGIGASTAAPQFIKCRRIPSRAITL